MSPYSKSGLSPSMQGELYKQAFDVLAEGVFIVAVAAPDRFILLDINPAFESLTGWRASAHLGCEIAECERFPSTLSKDCQRCVATDAPVESKWQVPDADADAELHLRLTPIHSSAGAVTRLIGELRKESSAGIELSARDAQFQTLVANAPDFIGRYTPDGRWIYMNPALERASGVKLEQVHGRTIADTMPASETTRRFHAALLEAVRTRTLVEVELRSDAFILGEPMWHHVQLVPEMDLGGTVISVIAIGREITQKRRAEELSRELTEKFRSLIEKAPDPIASFDAAGRYQYINPALEQATGLTLDQARGKTPLEVGPVTSAVEHFQQMILQVIRTGVSAEGEFLIDASLQGGPACHHIRAVPEFDREQRVAAVLAIGRDITRIKQAEHRLRQREQEFRTLAENSPDFISRFDRNGRVLYVNPAVESVIQKPLAELQAMPLSLVIAPLADGVREAIRTGLPLEMETCLQDPVVPNLSHWHLIRFVPEFDQDNEIMSVLSIGLDISRLKQTEEQLRQREREFRILAENSPDIIARFDRDLRVRYVNRALTQLTGLPVEYFIGTLPGQLESGVAVHIEKLREACRRAFDAGVTQKEEVTFPNGSVFESQIVPERDSDGVIVTVMSISRDITEIRRSEAAMRQLNVLLEERVAARTTELEEANRELEKFAYTVSHDLRAPLRTIQGFVSIFLSEEREKLSDGGRRMLEQIGDAGSKLSRMIENILEYSRAGHQELQRQPVNMEAVAREAVEACHSVYPGTQVDIGELPDAYGDPTMLRQVFQNLVSNAFKFSSKSTEPRITIGAQRQQERIVYFVADNGVGFDMRHADKLFGVFQRLHSDRDFPGTGAGLAIVKRLVERHGGRVWVESKPNTGTTFRFTLRAG